MNEKIPVSLDEFLSEISASLSSTSGEAALRRINTERVLRLTLEEIVSQRHDLQIRILSDSRLAGQLGADILMQIDDYEIRLALIDAPSNQINLTTRQLETFWTLFEENPSTEAIILTWTTEELLSQKLSLNTIDYLRDNPTHISAYLKKVKSLPDVIEEILDMHMRVWETASISSNNIPKSLIDIRQIFEKHLSKELKNEQKKSFRNKERKDAARYLDLIEDQESNIIINVLNDALRGQKDKVLVPNLCQVVKRGGQ